MKTKVKMLVLVFLLAAGMEMVPRTSQAYVGVSFRLFYDELRPYGTWMNTPEYGMVWVPAADPGFRPYATSGYWIYSAFGWTWVSDYSWGWAPFHYGRWYFDDRFGWAWVPGMDWGPAWVSWREGNGFYGWAPLAPGFLFSGAYAWNLIPVNYWVFVRDRDFGCRDLDRYAFRGWDHDRIYRNTHFLENTFRNGEGRGSYFTGPQVEQVRQATGRDFRPRNIRAGEVPGIRENTAPVPGKNNGIDNRGRSRREPTVTPLTTERQPEFRPPTRTDNNRNDGFRQQPSPRQGNPYAERNVRPEPRPQNSMRNVQHKSAPRSERPGQPHERR